MERHNYDLSHYVATCGNIGRLQTLQVIPVVANDSMEINMNAAMRLSPLRTALTLDAKVDLFAFFVPHRHVYGDDWVTMMKEGRNSTVTLPTVVRGSRKLGYIPCVADPVPKYLVAGYAQIWNQYFRVPNVTMDEADWVKEDSVLPSDNEKDYGHVVARLPTYLSSGVKYDTDASFRDVSIDTGNNTIDLLDIKDAKSFFKTEVDRDYFQRRYRDVLEGTFGSKTVNIDADKRPELLGHQSLWMSGYDVDATDYANIGNHSGKASTMANLNIPMKHFKEGGAIWIMACVRFPTIFNFENHYLACNAAGLDYDTIAGDPSVYAAQRPQELELSDFSGNASDSGTVGFHPYGNWYRFMNNYVHKKYHTLAGFPFISNGALGTPTVRKMVYEEGNSLDMFDTTKEAQWNLKAKINVEAKRVIPPASTSINAGTK